MQGDVEDRLRELLERERLHDSLTGLPNRVLLVDRRGITWAARWRRGSWKRS